MNTEPEFTPLSREKALEIAAQVVGQFDFEKVRKAMEENNWIYAGSDGPLEVSDLVETAMPLLIHVLTSNDYENCTGGFRAARYSDSVELSFCLETAGACLP